MFVRAGGALVIAFFCSRLATARSEAEREQEHQLDTEATCAEAKATGFPAVLAEDGQGQIGETVQAEPSALTEADANKKAFMTGWNRIMRFLQTAPPPPPPNYRDCPKEECQLASPTFHELTDCHEYPFSKNYPVKGCYGYKAGTTYSRCVFWGEGGTAADRTTDDGLNEDQIRICAPSDARDCEPLEVGDWNTFTNVCQNLKEDWNHGSSIGWVERQGFSNPDLAQCFNFRYNGQTVYTVSFAYACTMICDMQWVLNNRETGSCENRHLTRLTTHFASMM